MQIFKKLFNPFQLILVGVIALILVSAFPNPALAYPYGRCPFNRGKYSEQCPNASSGSNSGSGSNSSSGSNTCNDQPPASAPNLFQINTTGSSAQLYFAPARGPYSSYNVSFGDGTKDEGYGAGFSLSQTSGALKYDVYKLKPNTRYTFKVRAGNGCKAGPWSSTLAVKTGAKNSKFINKYYPTKQAYFTRSVWARVNGLWTSVLKLLPR